VWGAIFLKGAYFLNSFLWYYTEMMNTQKDSFNCLESWGRSVAEKNKSLVLAHYHETASLWPTLSNELRQSNRHIGDYFDHFLPKIDGEVEWNQCAYHAISDTHCSWSGIYTFHLTSGVTRARFSYVLTKINNAWKILHHHSSLMPEA
jgi:hypothetical protein